MSFRDSERAPTSRSCIGAGGDPAIVSNKVAVTSALVDRGGGCSTNLASNDMRGSGTLGAAEEV